MKHSILYPRLRATAAALALALVAAGCAVGPTTRSRSPRR